MKINIRPIQPADNPFLAKIVKDTLAEFGANHPGTVYYDATTDALYELFQAKGAAYFVAEINNEIVGGGGIYPTEGLPADTCELVKMYLLPKARGTGLGRTLIERSTDFAKETLLQSQKNGADIDGLVEKVKDQKLSPSENETVLTSLAITYNLSQTAALSRCTVNGQTGPNACQAAGALIGFYLGDVICGPLCGIGGAIIGAIWGSTKD